MSLIKKSTDNIDKAYLSSNDKVMHYLQNSKLCLTTNSLTMLHKPSSSDLFPIQHRLRSCSENDSMSSSSSSAVDELSRSDASVQSSLSDPAAHCSITSSNISSEEELDFNIGFDQISGDDDFDEDDNQRISNKNNADAVTLLSEAVLDSRINEFEDFFRRSSISTFFNDEYEFNNDDTLTADYIKQPKRASFLYDSTHTLCSEDRFSPYPEDDSDDQETKQINGLSIRSNSLNVLQIDEKSTLLEKAPKKIVRFADVLGLDLESIHYMSPPEQTTSTLTQECVRVQFGQLRFGNNLLDIPDSARRSRSSSLSSSLTKQHNLVSKNFISPINIIPLIYDKQVLLECIYTKDSIAYGTIRVHNCAYDKRVFIRLSQDEWKTSNDIQALHSMNSSRDNTDTFIFEIILPKSNNDTTGPNRILFSVCLQAMWQEFWDNNQGWNYVLDVVEKR